MKTKHGWIKRTSESQYHLTNIGYTSIRSMPGVPSRRVAELGQQMSKLFAELQEGLSKPDTRFVREFFVLRTRQVVLVGSEKLRFVM